MEDQRIINLLDNTQNKPSKFITRNCVEINDESRGTYNISNQFKFNTSIRSHFCDYSDAYIHVKGAITALNAGTAAAPDNRNKKVILKNCAPFTNCINEINNTELDDAHVIDVVMSMYNLIEYSDIYWKILGSLWQYYRGELALNNNHTIIDFPGNDNNSVSFKF